MRRVAFIAEHLLQGITNGLQAAMGQVFLQLQQQSQHHAQVLQEQYAQVVQAIRETRREPQEIRRVSRRGSGDLLLSSMGTARSTTSGRSCWPT